MNIKNVSIANELLQNIKERVNNETFFLKKNKLNTIQI